MDKFVSEPFVHHEFIFLLTLFLGELKKRDTKSFQKILGFHRTLSSDAIHTGCKGLVRSKDWMTDSAVNTINHEAGAHLMSIL